MIFMIIKNFFQWLDFSSNDYIWINDRGEAQDPRSSLSSHVNHILPSVNATSLWNYHSRLSFVLALCLYFYYYYFSFGCATQLVGF